MQEKCMVSLESGSVEACTLLGPWTLEEDKLMKLEYFWGLKYRTLNFNLEANTIYLTPELRRKFESDLWALLPVNLQLLETITDTDFTLEKPIETAYEGMDVFDYVFVPLPGMEGTITRLVEQGPSLNISPQEHPFPYTTLPVLQLHVQPHYVVIDLYRKILDHERLVIDIREEEGYGPYFLRYALPDATCRGLYKMWMSWPIPPSFMDDSGADIEGNCQRRTTLRRRYPESFIDEIGLRPTDSVTFVSDREDGEDRDSSDDDDDEVVVDETDSAFESRMSRWVADLQPGLTPPDFHPPLLDTMEMHAAEVTVEGSPTMVGSISLHVDSKMEHTGDMPTHNMNAPFDRTQSISDMSFGSSDLVAI